MCRKIGGRFISFLILLNRILEYILKDFKEDSEADDPSQKHRSSSAEDSKRNSEIQERNESKNVQQERDARQEHDVQQEQKSRNASVS